MSYFRSLYLAVIFAAVSSGPTYSAPIDLAQERSTCTQKDVQDIDELHRAQNLEKAQNWKEAKTIYLSLLKRPLIQSDILFFGPIALQFIAHHDDKDLVGLIPELHAETDPPRRELLAQLLLSLTKQSSNTVHDRVFIELADTQTSANALSTQTYTDWLKSADKSKLLSRARNLANAHRNTQMIELWETSWPNKNADSPDSCEMRYLAGLSLRKLRQYASATQLLTPIPATCTGEISIKAQYILARLAAITETGDNTQVFDNFIKRFPGNSFTDDVMMWKASILEGVGKWEQAAAAYQLVLDQYPLGDMAPDARFRLAFLLARHDKTDLAIASLEPQTSDERARYWKARLMAYPAIEKLTPNTDAKKVQQGMLGLQALANDRPTSYYGAMAKSLLQSNYKAEAATQAVELKLKVPKELKQDPLWCTVFALQAKGYAVEGQIVLDQLALKHVSVDAQMAIAYLYTQLDNPGRSHQIFRQLGTGVLSNKPSPDTQLAWQLSYPAAQAQFVDQACKQEKIPPELMYGLIREESAFQPDVISWAGAMGLCQLMPSTAQELNKKLKLAGDKNIEVLDPKTNITLGARRLAIGLAELPHPLLGIAAYNAGEAVVRKWVKRTGPNMPIDAFIELIPIEQTRNYVKKVASAWATYAYLLNKYKELNWPIDVATPAK